MATVQIRYIVNDVDAAIPFYVAHLGFQVDMHPAPAFAMLSLGDLRLVFSAPNPAGGGGQPMPDGTAQQPGGWNRFAVQVDDLATTVERLRRGGVHFRNSIVTGVGGKQVICRRSVRQPHRALRADGRRGTAMSWQPTRRAAAARQSLQRRLDEQHERERERGLRDDQQIASPFTATRRE